MQSFIGVSPITNFSQYGPSNALASQVSGSPCLLHIWSSIETVWHFPPFSGSAASSKHSCTQHPAIPAKLVQENTALRATVKTDSLPLQSITNGNQHCLDGISNLKGKHLSRKKELNKEKDFPDPVLTSSTPKNRKVRLWIPQIRKSKERGVDYGLSGRVSWKARKFMQVVLWTLKNDFCCGPGWGKQGWSLGAD